jgi:DNA-binding GntR family transcriptional regulator
LSVNISKSSRTDPNGQLFFIVVRNGTSTVRENASSSDRNLSLPEKSAHSIRITPQPVRRQVEDYLRKAIMDGDYVAGEHLSDRVLCEQLGVSRSVVREAVRLLEAEGLVTVVPYRGPFVAFLSAAEATQIYEVRGALEALAGAGFAERASNKERSELREIYEALAASDPASGKHALLEIKRRFYEVLLRGCGNVYAARMLEQVLNRNTQLRATSLSKPDRLPHTIREMARIVEAIERQDAEGARQACLDHVRAAACAALEVLQEREARQSRKAPD